ncbi:MAG: CoA transferase subunit A [Bacillota bacterium]
MSPGEYRGSTGKVRSLKEVVASIADGSHVAMGGFAIARNPIAFVHELIRQNKRHLTVSQIIGGMDSDLLVGAGCVDELIYGGGSLDRFGRIDNINNAICTGSIRAHEYSALSMTFRYLAGQLGLPFIPLTSMRGSDMYYDLIQRGELAELDNPFDPSSKVLVAKPLVPDYTVIAVPIADCEGNVWINGPRWDVEAAKAAKHLIVLAEQVTEPEAAKRMAQSVAIAGVCVEAVVHVPFCAYPTSMYGVYDYDPVHLKLYAEYSGKKEKFDEYLNNYVLSCKDHMEYLEKCGGLQKMVELRADVVRGYS